MKAFHDIEELREIQISDPEKAQCDPEKLGIIHPLSLVVFVKNMG